MNNKRWLVLFLIFLADCFFSFFQHLNMALDGDMSAIILPAEWYSEVLKSPFGFNAILNGETYGGTNRFFSHWLMSKYFKCLPLVIQSFTSPVNSLYISCALFKTIIQICLTITLAKYIYVATKNKNHHLILICCFLFPFFQTNGFHTQMGIVDKSITYVFFYAFPLLLTLIWFYPFFKTIFTRRKTMSYYNYFYLVPLAFIICFSGPLVQPVIFLVCPASLLYLFVQNFRLNKSALPHRILFSMRQIPKHILFLFIFLISIALYSYYLGQFNVENVSNNTLSLIERYIKLIQGIFKILTIKIGWILIFFFTLINCFFLKKYGLFNTHHTLFKIFAAIVIFSILYLMLLPLGGFRFYRPYIVRYDTFMPISIALICFFILSCCYVFEVLKERKQVYIGMLLAVLVVFQFADKFERGSNKCEKRMLNELTTAGKTEIRLSESCSVLSWKTIKNPGESRINAEMLYIWNVTDKPVLYYHK